MTETSPHADGDHSRPGDRAPTSPPGGNPSSLRHDETTLERFEFGKNWQSFLDNLDEDRIEQAVESLREMLQVDRLDGKTFLDIGSGSGLFSLAARRLGAAVVSIDYDPQSVACTSQLRRRENSDESVWRVERGSVLDEAWMPTLGEFDIVYSWGVLHHTGDMKRAIGAACERVRPGGLLFIAIYNDQGGGSRRWLTIKRCYHRSPSWFRPIVVMLVAGAYELKFAAARLASLRNPLPFADWAAKRRDRGMSAWHDWVDWIGGLPFEVATPEAIIMPRIRQGFELARLTTVGSGWGCNQYVFRRQND